MAPQMTIAEAARALGVSRRTIERRVKRGRYVAWSDDGRRTVDVPDAELPQAPVSLADVQRQLADARVDRDMWQQQAERLSATNAQLVATNQQLNDLLARLAMPALASSVEPAVMPGASESPSAGPAPSRSRRGLLARLFGRR